MPRLPEITCEKTFPRGHLVLRADITPTHPFKMIYEGYPKKEALHRFKQELKAEMKK
jgi:hypothetical protein